MVFCLTDSWGALSVIFALAERVILLGGSRGSRREIHELLHQRTRMSCESIYDIVLRLVLINPLHRRVLVYPPSGTGAVNITRGDLKRLDNGQYLNDTLIEFGLKYVCDLGE